KSLPKRQPVLVRSARAEALKQDDDGYKDVVNVLEPYHTSTIQPLEINWFFHDKELLTAFKQWLIDHRPHRAQEKRGRTESRVLLNALAAKRLLDPHSPAEADEITGRVLGESLFRSQSDW